MRVLIAVDGSDGSLAAAREVGELLSATDDSLALYCSPPAAPRFAGRANPEVLARAQQAITDAIFEEARKQFPAGLQATAHTISGTRDARHGIVEAAEEWGAELIVVGARGLGAIERLLLGSVSRAVVHTSKVPVWVARPHERVAGSGRRVLLACENAEQGAQSAEVLRKFTWPAGSCCRTLAVVPSLFAGQVPEWLEKQARSPDVEEMVQAWAREHDAEIEGMQQQMDAFLERLPTGLSDCKAIVQEGEPTSVILAKIKEEQVDLTVVGAHHKNWLTTTLLGSTSEAVLNHSATSVLVVPHIEET